MQFLTGPVRIRETANSLNYNPPWTKTLLLTSLALHRYGNYESERIWFDPRPGTVNVLLAPNSAGKSVLRADRKSVV